MLPEIKRIKGIHPGIILKREIKKRELKNKDLALMVDEHAQTISAIIKGARSITPKLSIKLGEIWGIEKDYFMLLQASYDVYTTYVEESENLTPNLENIRSVLFWDTDFNKINWIKNKRSVIKRVFERGNNTEISEIINFYGMKAVKIELKNIKFSYLPSFEKNVKKYVHL